MKATFSISEKDYVNANKLFATFTPSMTLAYVVGASVLMVVIIFGSPIIKSAAIGGLIGGVAMMLIGRFIITPWLAKRHYRSYKAIQDEFTVQLLDDGVRFLSSSGEGKLAWNSILKWRQSDEYILIYLMPRLYHIVPTSVSEKGFDIQQLTDKLHAEVGKSI